MKVLLISPLPPPAGGIARWTELILAEAATRPGLTIDLIDTRVRWRPLAGVTRTRRLIAGIVGAVSITARVAWQGHRCQPDVVHLNTSGSLGLARDLLVTSLLRTVRVPYVLHIRFGRVPHLAKQRGLEWRLLRRIVRHAAAVVVLDDRTHAALAAEQPVVRTIPNCAALADPSHKEPIVLFVGHVTEAKGITELAQAWAASARPGWRLRIAGAVPAEPPSGFPDLQARDDVEVLGELSGDKVRDLLRAASIFVLPSHTEGFPNALLEALMAGCCCVSTPVGAVPEMLANDAGMLVPVGDVDQLAVALATLIDNEELRADIASRGRESARRRYSVSTSMDAYEEVWADCQRRTTLSPGGITPRVSKSN